ncbi:MAG: LabA-like NYN domain-containing protein [Promethearchaeota archaeon]
MLKNERIILFIDNSNLFYAFRAYGIHCDYLKLKEVISHKRNLIEAILYMGIMYPVKEKDKAWLSKLSHLGYHVKTRAVKVAPNGRKKEKRIDILMAIDIIAAVYEKSFDKVVLVSGDGDFIPVIKKLKELNKKVEIWSSKNLLSEQIKDIMGENNYFYIEDILDKIKF